MKIIDYYTLNLPDYSLSYLINGDGSGLEDCDIETIDTWHADMLAKCQEAFPGCTYDLILRDDDEGSFAWSPEFGLACDCVDAVFAVFADNEDSRPAFPLPWEEESGEEPEEDTDQAEIDLITSAYNQIMASAVFRTDGPEIDLPELLTELGNAVHAASDLPESIWSLGECSEASLDSLIVGAYWSLTEWHAGQYSDTYAAMCSLGQVFSPGMASAPEPETSEYCAYAAISEWLERKAGK